MITTPVIIQTEAQLIAFVHIVVPRTEIHLVMGPAMSEVYATLAAQAIAPTGPWFTHHQCRPGDVFDFKACVPIAQPVQATGRVEPGELPARPKVARTIYQGDYAGLGDAWADLMRWIEANAYQAEPDLWECYIEGPERSADPAAWRTELNKPLLDRPLF